MMVLDKLLFNSQTQGPPLLILQQGEGIVK